MSDLGDLLREHAEPGRSLRRRPSRLGQLFDETYPDPSSLTLEESARMTHDDLALLADQEIDRERVMSMVRWAFAERPSPWLEERRVRLDREAARRKKGGR